MLQQLLLVHAVASAATLLGIAEAAAAGPTSVHQPGYHVFAPNGWINDPNAPLQYKGRTHLFFQYNPYKPAWGSIHWGHVVSEDLVTWRWLPPALQPDTWYDEGGVFSGSATITPEGTPVVLYTAVSRADHGADFERQALALPADPADPLLVDWVKPSVNPIIEEPPPGGDPLQFRDPTTAWRADLDHLVPPVKDAWVTAVGVQDDCVGGAALYYTSNVTSKSWSFLGTLASQLSLTPNIIHSCMAKKPDEPVLGRHRAGVCDPLGPCKMWECPDLFSLQGAAGGPEVQVVKYSDQSRDRLPESMDWYLLSTQPLNYSAAQHQDEQDAFAAVVNGQPYLPQPWDYGSVYASKSFLAEDGRRLWWGWVYETSVGCVGVCGDGSNFTATEGWQGLLTTPREVKVNTDTMSLVVYPVKELEGLREQLLVHLDQEAVPSPPAATQQLVPLQVLGQGSTIQDVAAGRQYEAQLSFRPPPAADVQARFGTHAGHTGALGTAPYTLWLQLLTGANSSVTVSLYGAAEYGHADGQFSIKLVNMSLAVDRQLTGGHTNATWQSGVVPLPGKGAVPAQGLQLSVWVDHSVLEVFALKGLARLTSRIYPEQQDMAWGLAAGADWGLGNSRGTLSADVWRLRTGWVEWPAPEAPAKQTTSDSPTLPADFAWSQVWPFFAGAVLLLGCAIGAAWDFHVRYRGYQRLASGAAHAQVGV